MLETIPTKHGCADLLVHLLKSIFSLVRPDGKSEVPFFRHFITAGF